MSNRLDQEREKRLQPERMSSCAITLKKLGYEVIVADSTQLIIKAHGIDISLWPYSGWWSGKKIGSDRGFAKLLKKLRELEG